MDYLVYLYVVHSYLSDSERFANSSPPMVLGGDKGNLCFGDGSFPGCSWQTMFVALFLTPIPSREGAKVESSPYSILTSHECERACERA